MWEEIASFTGNRNARPESSVIVCTPEGQIRELISVSPQFSAILQVGASVFNLVYPDQRDESRQKWEHAILNGLPIAQRLKYRSVDRQWTYGRLEAQIGVDHNQERVITVVSDVDTNSFHSPSLIARCKAIMDTAVDAIVTINDGGIIETVNPATIKMFGYETTDLIGQNVSMLMPEPERSRHDGYLADYLETRKAAIIGVGRRVTGRRRDGSEFPIHLAVSEYFVEGHRFFTGIIRDLSELEQVQQQLLQSERLVAIGQMVTGLAHESRNALQRAQGCLDMLSLDLADQPEQSDLARRAKTALQDLHRLYEEVRSYAAPIHLEVRDCDLPSIWRKEWENLSTIRTDSKMTLTEALGCQNSHCEVDVHRIEQVFRNIFENAVHACGPEGTVHIRCSPAELHGAPAVRIVVEDNGCGLSSEAAKQIFEPFFTTKQKGTGLGMAIVQRVIAAHSGIITAQRAPVRGTMITIVLPVNAMNRNAFRSGR